MDLFHSFLLLFGCLSLLLLSLPTQVLFHLVFLLGSLHNCNANWSSWARLEPTCLTLGNCSITPHILIIRAEKVQALHVHSFIQQL